MERRKIHKRTTWRMIRGRSRTETKRMSNGKGNEKRQKRRRRELRKRTPRKSGGDGSRTGARSGGSKKRGCLCK